MLTPFKTGAKVEGKGEGRGIRMRQAAIRLTQLIPPPRPQKTAFHQLSRVVGAKYETEYPGMV